MANFSAETVTSSGLDPTANPATAAGDTVPPETIVRVINGDASPTTLTVATPQVVDGDLAVADREVVVPAGETRYVRITRLFRDSSDGLVHLTWSNDTSITFEVIR